MRNENHFRCIGNEIDLLKVLKKMGRLSFNSSFQSYNDQLLILLICKCFKVYMGIPYNGCNQLKKCAAREMLIWLLCFMNIVHSFSSEVKITADDNIFSSACRWFTFHSAIFVIYSHVVGVIFEILEDIM